MEGLIQQAFIHVEVIGEHVQEGHYDLHGPDGQIILPQVWQQTVKPDWDINMTMWPVAEDKEEKKEEVPPPPPNPDGKKGKKGGKKGSGDGSSDDIKVIVPPSRSKSVRRSSQVPPFLAWTSGASMVRRKK